MVDEAMRQEAGAALAVLEERMVRYDQLLTDLREGRIDQDAFRRRAVSAGLVVERDGAWIFDLANTRWLYYDGVELQSVAGAATSPGLDQD
jgi:hypothetical protein